MRNLSIIISIVISIGLLTSCQQDHDLQTEVKENLTETTINEVVNSEDPAELPAIEHTTTEIITDIKEFLKEETTPLAIDEKEETTTAESRSGNFYESFQRYYLGNISSQSYRWNMWNPRSYFDAQVQRTGGNQYIYLERKSGYSNHNQPDVICDLGTKRHGKYEVSFYMWVPFHHSGYFNVQKDLTLHNANNEFGAEVYFYGSERGKVKVGGYTKSFNYNQNEWMKVKLIVDLTRNVTTMYINGYRIYSWYCTDTSRGRYGRKQIEGIDFYPFANNSKFYVDGVNFKRIY